MPGRRWRIGFRVAMSIAAMLAIVVMVNYISARHFHRFLVGSDSRPTLSPLTLQILKSLTNDVKVIVFFDRREPLYGLVAELLDEYRLHCPRLKVEHVDYIRYRARGEMIQAQYRLSTSGEGDRVIFESGGRVKVVYDRELSEIDYSAVLQGREARRTGFKGEQLFTSALFSLADPKPVKAYFVQGHSEHDPNSQEELGGYLKFARLLEESNIQWGNVLRLGEEGIPEDCQLLIIAGPKQPFAREELEEIENYLRRGGRLLALINIDSVNKQIGLERLLLNWGVEIGRNFVTDAAQSKAGDPGQLIVGEFGTHPIMKPLLGSRLVLFLPRSVTLRTGANQSADAPKGVELAFTSPQGEIRLNDGPPERTGKIPLIAAVERGSIQGISASGAARIVVVGESLFLGNVGIEFQANRDFARSAVNWLLNREVLLDAIGPRPITEYRVTLTRAQMETARWLLLAVFPGIVLLAGTIVWVRRRY